MDGGDGDGGDGSDSGGHGDGGKPMSILEKLRRAREKAG
jgi:hypothetical protein